MTLLLIKRPRGFLLSKIYDLSLIAMGSILLAFSARIYIPLPFSPVPVTGQTLALFLIGATMGRNRGILSVFTYILMGFSGIPVFAGGTSGLSRILGPTGGYLIGFLLAAYLIGYLSERGWDRKLSTSLLTFLLGNIVIYIPGLIHLSIYTGWKNVLYMGFYPFIPGDILKIILAGISLPAIWRTKGGGVC